MKILDIITPHETLTEDNFLTKWFARTLGRSAGTTAESKVSSWVETAISALEAQTPGHKIKRSEELKRAERALVSVLERNPYPQEAEKIESIAQSLSEYLVGGPGRSIGDNAVKTLVTLVRQGSAQVPSVFASKAEFLSDAFITSEMRGGLVISGSTTPTEMAGSKYIRELAEARATVYTEIENIQPVKTRAQKKKEKEEADLEKIRQDTEKLNAKNDWQKAKDTADDLTVAKGKKDVGTFWQENKIGLIFAGTEAGRITVQFGQQVNNIHQWENGYLDGTPIPPEIAKYFPEEPDGGVPAGAPSIKSIKVTDRMGKPYYYRTKKQRYEQASWYAWQTISNLYVKQLCSGAVAWWAPALTQKTVGSGIGLLGKAKWAHNIIEFFSKAWANNPKLEKLLGGMSLTSKMLFADFMMTSVVEEQDSSQNLAYWINSLVGNITGMPLSAGANATNAIGWTDFTPEELTSAREGLSLLPDYAHSPQLNKALASIMLGSSIEEMSDGYAKEFLTDALRTYAVPYVVATQIFLTVGAAVIDATKYIAPIVLKQLGTTKGKLPDESGNKPATVTPVTELPPPASNTGASTSQDDLSGNQTNTGPVTNTDIIKDPKAKTTNSELDPFIIKESLKQRVERLMRS